MKLAIYLMIYSGSALMVYNIIRYYKFARDIKQLGVLEKRRTFIDLPFFLLVFFLIGYLVTGLFGNPNLMMAGVLFGVSIYVFLMLGVMIRIIRMISNDRRRVSAMYNELREELSSITKNRLAVFRVNLTKDIIEDRAGTDLYDSDLTAKSYSELLKHRYPDPAVKPADNTSPGSFTREGLLEHFQNGYNSASEIVYACRKSKKYGYYLLEASIAQQPMTGDVIAFITERDYNRDMIDEIIWKKALCEEYDGIAYIACGQLGIVLSGDRRVLQDLKSHGQENLEYEAYIRNWIGSLDLAQDPDGLLEALSLERIEAELSDKDAYTVDFSFHREEETYKRFTFFAADREGHFYTVMISDTTEIRREQEKQNRILEEALQQVRASSAAKTVFLSNMSHDIRTPMNAIIGFTNLAKQSVEDPEKTGEYLEKILTSSSHLLSLINDVLEMSRIESGKIELENSSFRLTELAEDLYAMVENLAEAKRQKLTMDTSRVADDCILCDRLRLNQVLLNIVSNAVKYTPEGGCIDVSILQTGKAENGRGSYEFHVKDNGIGMSPEFAAHVFEAFEREKTSTISRIQGTGLGMAITKRIVDLMDGTIDVITEEGKGTEFIVRAEFGISQEIPEQKETTTETTDVTGFSGKRLLLVDDMDINREIAKTILEMNQFTVEEAKNGEEAVTMVQASEPGYYDAVLMDIQMPVLNGYEAAKKIRQLENKALADIPILAMTANAFEDDRKNAMEAGMNGHVAKPINVTDLLQALKTIL